MDLGDHADRSTTKKIVLDIITAVVIEGVWLEQVPQIRLRQLICRRDFDRFYVTMV
ncbi:MAG: hypothetical protein VB875_02570 [Pirellulales bacterium]